jgi:hypothetical protein
VRGSARGLSTTQIREAAWELRAQVPTQEARRLPRGRRGRGRRAAQEGGGGDEISGEEGYRETGGKG